jgi:hypothetical protein
MDTELGTSANGDSHFTSLNWLFHFNNSESWIGDSNFALQFDHSRFADSEVAVSTAKSEEKKGKAIALLFVKL